MELRSECPNAEALQQLLLGLGEPAAAAELERHFAECPECAQRAENLRTEDDVVRSVRRAAAVDDTPITEAVDGLMSVFRRIRPGVDVGATAAWSGASTGKPGNQQSETLDEILAPPQRPEEIGRLGPYSIDAILGSGGMGVVYRGFDPQLQRRIAVKVVRPELLSAPDVVERFIAEARAAAAVEHDNIVVVHAVEIHGGVPCCIMPLLKGETLEERLRRTPGPLSTAELLQLGRETASGLAAAHERGLIHRDIKPANLWLEEMPNAAFRVRILDFGLAVIALGENKTGLAGTPGYMAPEQIRGLGVDARTDLFALGCVLYRAATGEPAFLADTWSGMLVRTLTREPIAAKVVNPDLPAELARLIARLLASDPAKRPESASAVASELRALENEIATRRTRLTRRWFLVAAVGAMATTGLTVWFARSPKAPVPEPPVRIDFTLDPEISKVVFTRDETGRTIDLRIDKAVSLVPGVYELRLETEIAGRELMPREVTVKADEPQTVKLALIGEVSRNTAHTREVMGVSIVPGKERITVLSASRDRTLGAWEPESKERPRKADLECEAWSLGAAADGSTVVTGGGNKQPPLNLVQVWDGVTLKAKGASLDEHTRLVTAVAVSSDGKQILSAATGEVYLWDAAARTRRTLEGHGETARVLSAAFDPTGKRAVTGDDDGSLIVWDVVEGKLLKKLSIPAMGEATAIRAVVCFANGFVSAGEDGMIRLWDGTTYKPRELRPDGMKRSKTVWAVAVSKDGKRLLSGGDDGTIRLWSVGDGTLIHTFTGHKGEVRGVAFTPDGRGAVSGGMDRTVRLWRLPFE